jgi:hypothetical protein
VSDNPLNIHIDGFDRLKAGEFGTGAAPFSDTYIPAQGPYGVWRRPAANSSAQGVTGRFGGRAVRCGVGATGSDGVGFCLPRLHEPASFVVGVAFKATQVPGAFRQIFSVCKGFSASPTPTALIRVGVASTGQLQVTLSDVLDETDTTILGTTTWHYVEVVCTLAASGGIFRVYLDGVQLEDFDVDGDTQGSFEEAHIDGVWLGAHANSVALQECDIDDFYYTDGTERWGPVRITTFAPTVVTSNSGFLGDGEETADLHDKVEENWIAADTDYVKGADTGDQILFGSSDELPEWPENVFAVAVGGRFGKSDSGTRRVRLAMQTQSVQVSDAEFALADENHHVKHVWALDPHNDTEWTRVKVEDANFGIRNT